MIGASVCTGIGAPEVAAPWVDWRWGADIEPFPRAVMAALPEADLSTVVAHTLRGEGFDASEDGTGRGTPIVPILEIGKRNGSGASGGSAGVGQPGDPMYTLQAGAQHGVAIGFSSKDHGADAEQDLAPTLRAGAHSTSHANAGVPPAVAVEPTARSNRAQTNPAAWAVRRLTPRECERLQGFPDDWTRIPWRGREADQCPDGPRYRALGNAMNFAVMRWLLDRVRACWPQCAAP